jgi:YbbR domain-containing protein
MPGALTRNWEIRLASIAIAFALWLFVVSGDTTRVALAAPVEYLGLPPALVLADSRPSVDLELEAPRWTVARVTPSTVRVRVDLSGLGEGESAVQIAPAHVQAPPGATVTRITPAWVHVSLVAAATRTARVVPQIRGTPAPAHVIHRVLVEPPTVQVRGPRSTIEERAVVDTVPVDVSGSRATVTQTVALVTPETVSLVGEPTVQLTVEIRREDSMQRSPGDARQ